jgi:hypothetical protein
MNDKQKAICRELIALSYEHGFGSSYPLQPIADKLGITDVLYDNNTNTGLLWDLGPHGEGLLMIDHRGQSASVVRDTIMLLENWSRETSANPDAEITNADEEVVEAIIPRRVMIVNWAPAERAIDKARTSVEEMGADPLLTEAVDLINQAQEKVAAFVDRGGAPVANPQSWAWMKMWLEAYDKAHGTTLESDVLAWCAKQPFPNVS